MIDSPVYLLKSRKRVRRIALQMEAAATHPGDSEVGPARRRGPETTFCYNKRYNCYTLTLHLVYTPSNNIPTDKQRTVVPYASSQTIYIRIYVERSSQVNPYERCHRGQSVTYCVLEHRPSPEAHDLGELQGEGPRGTIPKGTL